MAASPTRAISSSSTIAMVLDIDFTWYGNENSHPHRDGYVAVSPKPNSGSRCGGKQVAAELLGVAFPEAQFGGDDPRQHLDHLPLPGRAGKTAVHQRFDLRPQLAQARPEL